MVLFLFCSNLLAEEPVLYLKNNIHTVMKVDRRGREVYMASYANYVDPGEGHIIIPINTPVTIKIKLKGPRGSLAITGIEDEKVIRFEYKEKNTGMSPKEYIKQITSSTKVSVDKFPQIDQKGILEGKAYIGMTKNGVKAALGYPATHRTPSLENQTWIYWKNRFQNYYVRFDKNGKVKISGDIEKRLRDIEDRLDAIEQSK
jgi:hypothetical protein